MDDGPVVVSPPGVPLDRGGPPGLNPRRPLADVPPGTQDWQQRNEWRRGPPGPTEWRGHDEDEPISPRPRPREGRPSQVPRGL